MASGNISWRGTLSGNLKTLNARNRNAMQATARFVAPQIQSHMRSNAPWTDQTGNARNGLFAEVRGGGDKVDIILYHSVPYGIWLEVRWSGRYAIILPSIQLWGPRYFALLAKALFKGNGR